jgi:hypothetical protein
LRTIILSAFLTLAAPLYIAYADTVIKEFSGDHDYVTKPFTVHDGWEIQWDAKGAGRVHIVLKRSSQINLVWHISHNDIVGVITNRSGKPNSGSVYQSKGGTYYLDIGGSNNWIVRIVEIN